MEALGVPTISVLCVVCLPAFITGCKPDKHGFANTSEQSNVEEIFRPAFIFPTKNHALLDANGSEHFFTPTTTAKSWISGTFGCVRNNRTRIHEGIDIATVERNKSGEPTDPVVAVYSGKVAHINRNIAASNYGKYVVLHHSLDGFSFYSLYGHLDKVNSHIQIGTKLNAGNKIGVLGRTTNTRDKIESWRAHLHFEIGVQLNSNFKQWFPSWYKDGINQHGDWNGLNLLGLDAAAILIKDQTAKMDFVEHLKTQKLLCRVRVYREKIDYLERYQQICINHSSGNTPIAWDISFNFSGVPIQAEAIFDFRENPQTKYRLLSVNEDVHNKHPCSGLLFKRGQAWTFTSKGQRLMDLLIFH